MEIKDQQKFWDEESNIKNYFDGYFADVINNRWIDMFTHVESKTGISISGNILEIGGGSQYLSRFLCKRNNVNIICTDISEDRIKNANFYHQAVLPNLKTLGGVNAQKLPFEDAQFDFIIGDAVLHHIEDLRRGLYEINRCLKAGGQAIFIREPVLGMDIRFKRILKNILYPQKFVLQNIEFIKDNRFEFDRYLSQWEEEFLRSGFKSKNLTGWYFAKFKERFKSSFPRLFTCHVSFHLQKFVDITTFEK